MAKRQDLVKGWQDIVGKEWFAYAGFRARPNHLPYAVYWEDACEPIYADNTIWKKKRTYIFRLVTEDKDWDLEDRIEDMMLEMELIPQKITDEPYSTEKVHVVEWQVVMVD